MEAIFPSITEIFSVDNYLLIIYSNYMNINTVVCRYCIWITHFWQIWLMFWKFVWESFPSYSFWYIDRLVPSNKYCTPRWQKKSAKLFKSDFSLILFHIYNSFDICNVIKPIPFYAKPKEKKIVWMQYDASFPRWSKIEEKTLNAGEPKQDANVSFSMTQDIKYLAQSIYYVNVSWINATQIQTGKSCGK